MSYQTTFHHDKLIFKDPHKVKFKGYITLLIVTVYTLMNSLNKELTTNRIIIISFAAISFISLIILLITGDFSNEIDPKNIKKIRLNINIFGNVILHIRNKKGKTRAINLGQNYREVSDYLDFAERNKLQIVFDKKKFAHIINEH